MKRKHVIVLALSIPAILVGIYYVMQKDYYRAVTNVGFIGTLVAPLLLERFTSLRFNDMVYGLYTIFMFLAAFLGAGLSFYQMISWYDVLMHTLSGTLTAFLGYFLLTGLHLDKSTPRWFHGLLIILVGLSVAAGWEFYEYILDLITGKDAQNSLTTGVADTMQDMLVAFAGTLPIVWSVVSNHKWLSAFRFEEAIKVHKASTSGRKAS